MEELGRAEICVLLWKSCTRFVAECEASGVFEKWGDMVIFPSIVDYFGGCVDESLKPIQMTRRKAG